MYSQCSYLVFFHMLHAQSPGVATTDPITLVMSGLHCLAIDPMPPASQGRVGRLGGLRA